ncbi:MAG: ATP-binding protein [Pirellulales bacterium]
MADDCCTWSIDEVIPSERGAGRAVQDRVLGELSRRKWNEGELFGVRLALEEAIVNAIKHGNQHDATKQVRIACEVSDDRLWVSVADEGPGFDPDRVPDPTFDERLEIPSGRGIALMKAFMCQVQYTAGGNCVVMEKRRFFYGAAQQESR